MKALFALAVGLVWLGTGCGAFLVSDPEGLPPSVWAADTCAVLTPVLGLPSTGVGDTPLAVTIDDARKDLEQLEPATGVGPFHDRLTDDLESIAQELADLAEDGASSSELDQGWARLRGDLIAVLRERADDLSSEAAVAFRASCPAIFPGGS